jgi:hypothetical protein
MLIATILTFIGIFFSLFFIESTKSLVVENINKDRNQFAIKEQKLRQNIV